MTRRPTPLVFDVAEQAWDAPIDIPMEAPDPGESFASGDLETLLDNSPVFTEGHAFELAALCRQFPVIRSAISFSMVKAREYEVGLRNSTTWEETCRLQGGIKALVDFQSALLAAMQLAEQPSSEKDHVVS